MENNSKRKELTTRQEEILEYIKKYSKENRMPPTVREIGNHFEISSTNGVFRDFFDERRPFHSRRPHQEGLYQPLPQTQPRHRSSRQRQF